MNKRAIAILLISSVGFLLALVAFYSFGYKSIPGGEVSHYLGSSGMNIMSTYHEGDSRNIYIDFVAERAFENASSEKTEDEVINIFVLEFGKYLEAFNKKYNYSLSTDDYDFYVKDGQVIGKCNKKLKIVNGNVEYSFSPSFRVGDGLEITEPSKEEKKPAAEADVPLGG